MINERKEATNQKKNERNLRLLFNTGLATKLVQQEKHRQFIWLKTFRQRRVCFIEWTQLLLATRSVNREEVLAQFEVLYAQLIHHKPQSVEQIAALRARLSDLAHAYAVVPSTLGTCSCQKSAFRLSDLCDLTMKFLSPNKGASVVILKSMSMFRK